MKIFRNQDILKEPRQNPGQQKPETKKFLKVAREKQLILQKLISKIVYGLVSRNLGSERQWDNTLKVLKEKKH